MDSYYASGIPVTRLIFSMLFLSYETLVHTISDVNEHPKTLGIQWNTDLGQFHLTITDLPPAENVTKHVLVSDIAKIFDVLGWFSPAIINFSNDSGR